MKKIIVGLVINTFVLGMIGTTIATTFSWFVRYGDVAHISEPATMLLFGIGLLRIAEIIKKNRFKHIIQPNRYKALSHIL